MALIYESPHFVVESFDPPHVDRDDGGHIKIDPKVRVSDRQQLSPSQAIELMRLTMVSGEAMKTVMNNRGVDIGRINYQDNGNWSVLNPDGPYLHIHLYGRAKSAKYQKWGEACYFPLRSQRPEYYAKCRPLTKEDVAAIKDEIIKLLRTGKYSDKAWGL